MGRIEATLEQQIRHMTPVSAPARERADVRALSRALDTFAHRPTSQPPRCKLVGPAGETLAIPESVFYALERVVEVLARGDAITVVPLGQVLTTQQAASLLNVSRQYLVRLLDQGEIPFSRTGTHRRLRIEDVLEFKAKRDSEREGALRKLTRLSEEYGGYEELE
jgi:excisionase family DNA binding protein